MKKLFALVLALALTVLSVAAFAAGSKTTDNLTYFAPVVNNDEPEETEETVEIATVPEEDSEVVAELAAEFAGKAANEVVTAIENGDALEATAELVELIEINVTGVKAGETGTIKATLEAPTEIKAGDAVRVLVLVDGKWYEIPSEVTEDGKIAIELSEEILALLQDAENPVIAVFTI